MSLAELEQGVEQLTPAEFSAFTRWMDEFAARVWDAQFEKDATSGKLDALGRKADAAFESGKCTEL